MDRRSHLLIWIGAFAGLVGVLILNFGPLDDLLPVNRMLLAAVCTLGVMWLLTYVIQTWGHRP